MKAYEIAKIITFTDQTQLLEEYGRVLAPTSTEPMHEVIQGDTLLTISEKYYKNHEDWVNIYLANRLFDPFTLEVGTKLLIPKVYER